MEKCDGIIVIAFRRMEIKEAIIRPNSDLEESSKYYRPSQLIQNEYKTSDWCNIEIGMAFGMNIPVLLFIDEFISSQDDGMEIRIEIAVN